MNKLSIRASFSGMVIAGVASLMALALILFGIIHTVAGNTVTKDQGLNKGPTRIGDITVELLGGRQIKDQFQVEVCYTLPDERDWLISISPTDTLLRINDKDYTVSEAQMISREKGSNGQYNLRCEALLFPVQNVPAGTPFQITLSKISVSESEIFDCAALQKKIDAIQPGISIQCATQPHVSGFHAVSWPRGITQAEANALAHDIASDARKGSWIFKDVSE
ncbi:hypothetical protein [Anaerolinea thermophila]|uniref:Uncharacterized protein n=1 Tax=Anaerolinea thermophila (strain DSM 14523 / JCM 11388 / NBRC 100420 / UNI-1) TaxID=926569 RepID=E8MZA3_ANATU|nr:hypothetical protein [Anaerolinea thermophila]BAJ62246.1 hypothetical protein ANT_02120 [Anaerolinea thermophila UNI-1]